MRDDATNPYVGLRPFDVDESILFFGRNDQTLELLQRLHQHHFVAVVGSSGSGKSSLLLAGLIPALKAGYLVDDSDHWLIAIMKPGQSPLYNLAQSILQNVVTGSTDVAQLVQKIKEEGADVLIDMFTPLQKEKNINFFLLVDQFEELFRFAMEQKDAARKDEAIDFVNIMLELSQNPQIPFYVVITMRSDFIGDCAQFYGLPEAMNKSQYLVPQLNRLQLKTVIEGPAKLYGGKMNPALTNRLLNDLGKIKDELPLLQHALMRIWDFEVNVNKSGELDMEDYDAIGGIENALSNHAEEALVKMNDDDVLLTKQIFQSLTAVDENGRKIRRPASLSALKKLTGATNEQIMNIINLFIKDKRCFLIVSSISDTSDKLIDISHESLIRQWKRLNKWVDEEAEAASFYIELSKSAMLNKLSKKDLLSGNELRIAKDWYDNFKPKKEWALRYTADPELSFTYLNNSMQQQKEQLRKKAMKTRMLVAVIVALVAVTAFFVNKYNQDLNKKAKLSFLLQKREKAIESENTLQALVYTAESLVLESDTKKRDSIIKNSIKNNLLQGYHLRNIFLNPAQVNHASISANAKIIFVWLVNDTLSELDAETGAVIQSIPYKLLNNDSLAGDLINYQAIQLILPGKNNTFNTEDSVLIDSSIYFKKIFLSNSIDTSNDPTGFPVLPNPIRNIDGAEYFNNNSTQQILTWGQNTESPYEGVNVWDQDGYLSSVTLVHDGINGATSNMHHNLILTWGADSTVRIWQYFNDTTSIRRLSPDAFKNKIQMETGVEMNPADYSIKIIFPADYIKRKDAFLKRQTH